VASVAGRPPLVLQRLCLHCSRGFAPTSTALLDFPQVFATCGEHHSETLNKILLQITTAVCSVPLFDGEQQLCIFYKQAMPDHY